MPKKVVNFDPTFLKTVYPDFAQTLSINSRDPPLHVGIGMAGGMAPGKFLHEFEFLKKFVKWYLMQFFYTMSSPLQKYFFAFLS